MEKDVLTGLQEYLVESPGCFHAVDALKRRLDKAGFTELSESERWSLKAGKGYYVIRSGSSIISFKLPKAKPTGFHIIASHSDSPSFKLKPEPALWSDGLLRLNVEGYGGMIRHTWFDRPLSIAGRVLVEEGDKLVHKLVYFDRDLVMIPSLAIHLDRDKKEGGIKIQSELLPLLGTDADEWKKLLSEVAGADMEHILGMDLFLTCRMAPTVWGGNNEFVSAPRLDDLACAYGSFVGLLAAKPKDAVALHCVFDNEEVGSCSMQGAESTFLQTTARRICRALGMDDEGFDTTVANSFMISADNAHALHPNYAGKYDPVNRPKMNAGIVLKHHAGQKYMTDAISEAVFKKLCQSNGVPYQEYANNSDVPGGSTLGNLSNTQISIRGVDIGLAQLAMHSTYETMGAEDTGHLAKLAEVYYSSVLPKVQS